MKNCTSSAARALSILDVIDSQGSITPQSLLDSGAARSSVYRDIKYLVDAGLLSRQKDGAYVSGPRYIQQPPGTRFDKEARDQRLAAEVRLIKERPGRVPIKTIAKELGYSPGVIRRVLKEYP